jgi:hypothetical protein
MAKIKKAQLGKAISGKVPSSVKVDTSKVNKSMNSYMKSEMSDDSWRKVDPKKDSALLKNKYSGLKKAKIGTKIKKAQNGINGAFAQSLEVKKSTLDSVRKKQKAAMDSSRASFSRGVQNAKSKISNEIRKTKKGS